MTIQEIAKLVDENTRAKVAVGKEIGRLQAELAAAEAKLLDLCDCEYDARTMLLFIEGKKG